MLYAIINSRRVNMKKTLILLTLLPLLFFISLISIKASNEVDTLVVHYFRYDNDYTNFNFWLWENEPDNLEGKQFNFNNNDVDDLGAFKEVNLKEDGYKNTTRFGIIVKKGGWEGYREPGGDRFFDLKNMEVINNKVHAYIVEQDLNIGTSTSDIEQGIPDYSPKILSARFETNSDINIRLSHIPKKIEVLENNKTIYEVENNFNLNMTIKISYNFDLLKNYQLHAVFDNSSFTKSISIESFYDTDEFEKAFTYEGELGAIYSNDKTTFRLWAPISEKVELNLYKQGHPNYDNLGNKNNELKPFKTYDMTKIEDGAWEHVINEDLASYYYTFSVTNYGQTHEVTDPYSYSTGANGLRSMVVNFEELNPEGWDYNNRPKTIKELTDYIVYELHIRDLTTHETWEGNEEYRGKFKGFTEEGTTFTNRNGITVSTGVDHIKELGVNAVQLLPIFDFGYIDEVEMALNPNYNNTFNWGYMPYHFNTLEGSYATNPFDGNVRISEFKELIQTLHNNDIRVIMDVVYNHTGESETSNFHKIIPGYYHRLNKDGGFSNGSGTGNETASERLMVRKFMVDSIKFLANEYNLSGFRFDLMMLHDVETMQLIEDELNKIDPTIVIYGEPWHAGGAMISDSNAAGKQNIKNFNNIGAFNDIFRDAVKGSVFNEKEGAWIQGVKPSSHIEGLKYGIVGGVDHKDVSYNDKWHLKPTRTINYVSAHDNNTLHDKLRLTNIKGTELEKMQIQANAITLTSQGIPFIHAGAELMRSKPKDGGGFDENSYESHDSNNHIRWDRKANYLNDIEYSIQLIHIRKHSTQLKMSNN